MHTDHHPPHIYLDNTWYMVTSSTLGRRRLLDPDGHKEIVRDSLHALVNEFCMELAAWVILANHYHILIRTAKGTDLPRFVGRLHGRTSHDVNILDSARGRQVWHNYFDTCIRDERGYWMRFNYVHHNPVKHRYVQECGDWPFSSYHLYVRSKGKEWLDDAFARYPIVDFTDVGDDGL